MYKTLRFRCKEKLDLKRYSFFYHISGVSSFNVVCHFDRRETRAIANRRSKSTRNSVPKIANLCRLSGAILYHVSDISSFYFVCHFDRREKSHKKLRNYNHQSLSIILCDFSLRSKWHKKLRNYNRQSLSIAWCHFDARRNHTRNSIPKIVNLCRSPGVISTQGEITQETP